MSISGALLADLLPDQTIAPPETAPAGTPVKGKNLQLKQSLSAHSSLICGLLIIGGQIILQNVSARSGWRKKEPVTGRYGWENALTSLWQIAICGPVSLLKHDDLFWLQVDCRYPAFFSTECLLSIRSNQCGMISTGLSDE